jgi:hypothetical protein
MRRRPTIGIIVLAFIIELLDAANGVIALVAGVG